MKWIGLTDNTWQMQVPGGCLYRIGWDAMCFVPNVQAAGYPPYYHPSPYNTPQLPFEHLPITCGAA